MMSRFSADSRVPRSTTVRSRSSLLTVCNSRSGRLAPFSFLNTKKNNRAARPTAPIPIKTRVEGNRRTGPSPISGGPELGESSTVGSFDSGWGGEDFGLDDGGRARLIDPDSAQVEG